MHNVHCACYVRMLILQSCMCFGTGSLHVQHIAEFEARHNVTMNICMYMYVVYLCMYHTFVSHACFRSTSGTTENGLHHLYETKEKTAS